MITILALIYAVVMFIFPFIIMSRLKEILEVLQSIKKNTERKEEK